MKIGFRTEILDPTYLCECDIITIRSNQVECYDTSLTLWISEIRLTIYLDYRSTVFVMNVAQTRVRVPRQVIRLQRYFFHACNIIIECLRASSYME